jgi:Raf kinase inhibitor-like YbhB/YbcL family protein
MSFVLVSSAFKDDGYIPPWYCGPGSDCSPPIGWTTPPNGAKSLALIVRTAESGDCHWVIYNIPPEERTFWGKIPRDPVLFDGALQGRNGLGNLGWDGPGLIDAEAVLHFSLSALDTLLSLEGGATAEEVETAMEGHVLGCARLQGRYKPH